jgi:hypothetical protein
MVLCLEYRTKTKQQEEDEENKGGSESLKVHNFGYS